VTLSPKSDIISSFLIVNASRGFSRGSIFDREGLLVASAAQEGLIRQLN